MPLLPVIQPSRVTVMIKPVGALCNLDCHYCYYLPTKTVYDGHEHRMTFKTLEEIFAGLLPHFADDVTIAWQGGEPTLAGLDFFKRALEFQATYARPGQRIHHALQTNGTLLDDEWCRFLHDNEFLIGLSIDGPPRFHDLYRVTNRKEPTSDAVLAGMRMLQTHGVDYNILCVLNDRNVHHPDEILQYLLKLGSRWVQFIPAIEWQVDGGRNVLADYSPDPVDYGKFLCRVFDLWFERYRKRVSVRIFDAVLNKLVLGEMPFCILDGACHNQMTIEHDGSVFGCDHFVERRWQLASIGQADWSNDIGIDGSTNVGLTIHGDGYEKLSTHVGRDIEGAADVPLLEPNDDGIDSQWLMRTDATRLGAFAQRKQRLPEKCVKCQWKPFCHGGCPKHRPQGGEVPEPTVLCEAYIMFYEHAMERLQWLAGFLKQNRQPPDPQPNEKAPRRRPEAAAPLSTAAHSTKGPGASRIGRNQACPCGSGLKYKSCHGR